MATAIIQLFPFNLQSITFDSFASLAAREESQMMRRKFKPDSRASIGLLVKALTSYGHPILHPLQKSHKVASCAMIFRADSEAKISLRGACDL